MPWCSQLWTIWRKGVRPLKERAPVALLLSGQACLRPSCYGGCCLPPGPRQLKAPVQGWSAAHSAKHTQNLPPGLRASTFQDQGSLLSGPSSAHSTQGAQAPHQQN